METLKHIRIHSQSILGAPVKCVQMSDACAAPVFNSREWLFYICCDTLVKSILYVFSCKKVQLKTLSVQ